MLDSGVYALQGTCALQGVRRNDESFRASLTSLTLLGFLLGPFFHQGLGRFLLGFFLAVLSFAHDATPYCSKSRR